MRYNTEAYRVHVAPEHARGSFDEGALYFANIPEKVIACIRDAYLTNRTARLDIEGLCEKIRDGEFSEDDRKSLLSSYNNAAAAHCKGKNFAREVRGRKKWARQQRVRKGTKCWA